MYITQKYSKNAGRAREIAHWGTALAVQPGF